MIEPNLKREKPVATYDEDSIALAVGAGVECVSGFERSLVDAVYFASTFSPYKEKLAAVTVATALDLCRDITVADFANSVREGTMAIKAALDASKAGSSRQALVVLLFEWRN